jgi:hypothetical protein
VVEGKLGWRRFVPLYLGLGGAASALEQLLMLGAARGTACGASAANYALVGMALLWAPRNDLVFACGVCLPPLVRLWFFDLSILWFAITLGLLDIARAVLYGADLRAEAAHVLGAVLGAAAGWQLLRRCAVDCEGWDLLSLLARDRAAAPWRTSGPAEPEPRDARHADRPARSRKKRSLRRIRELLDHEQPMAAWQELQATRHWIPDWRLPRDDLQRLAQQLATQGDWSPAAILLVEFVERFSNDCLPERLLAAEVLIVQLRRPQAGLRMLNEGAEEWPAELQPRRGELQRLAIELIDAGVIEFDRPV